MSQITLRNSNTGADPANGANSLCFSGLDGILDLYYTGTLTANGGSSATGTILNTDSANPTPWDGQNKLYIDELGCNILRISSAGEVMELFSNDTGTGVPVCTPVITVTGPNLIDDHLEGTVYTDQGATLEEECPSGGSITVTGVPDGMTVGNYTITYTYPNAVDKIRTVNVVPAPTPVPPTATPVPTPVPDTTPPVISLTGNAIITIEVDPSFTGPYIEDGATALDDVDNDISSLIVIGNLNNVDPTNVGVYTITYNVSDTAGNPAVEVTREIRVVDTTIPEIVLQGDNPLNINIGAAYSEPGFAATDNYDDNATLTGAVVVGGDTVDNSTVGQYNITYNVTDSSNNNAVEVIRVVNVNDTSAPIPENETYDVAWNATLAIILEASDNVDSSGSLTYTIVDQPTKGQLNADGGDLFTYTHTATVYGQDSFTFTATDSEGNVSLPGTITINPINSAPVLTDPGSIQLQQNSSVVFNVGIQDADGDAITIIEDTAVSNGTIQLIQTSSNLEVTYTPNLGHFGGDTWVIIGEDSKSEQSIPLTINFAIEAVPYFEMDASSFGSDPDAMCIAPKTTNVYGGTTYANNVSELSIGDTVYYDQNLTNKVTRPSNTAIYIKVSDSSKTRVLGINANGAITSIKECESNANSVFTPVRYASSENAFCDNDVQITNLWYNDDGSGSKTLLELVNGFVNVFSNEYDSDLFTVTNTVQSSIESGVYGDVDITLNKFYKRSSINTWGENNEANSGGFDFECEEEVPQETFPITVQYLPNFEDPNLNEFCAGQIDNELTNVTLWFSRDLGASAISNLLELAQSNIAIYKSQLGAQSQDPLDLFESNIFAQGGDGHLAWDNLGDGKNLNWYGYDINNRLVVGTDIVSWGSCSTYNDRPEINGLNDITSGNNDVNMFYAFYSYMPEIEGPEGSDQNDSEDIFWPIYVIDGLHTISSGDTGSYIKDFIDNLTIGNVVTSNNTGECLAYVSNIVAEDIDDAVLLLKNNLLDSRQRPVVSSGIQLGFASEEVIKVYEDSEATKCVLGNEAEIISTYTFPFVSDYDSVKAGPNFNTETNYKLDNVAKPLLRTNPKLSGNIKIVTDSSGTVYLESINASEKLAGIKYKKHPINPNGNYAKDVASFFRATGTPSDLIYLTKRANSDLTVHDSYNKQVEEEYQYGTTYNYSKNYDEGYKMFAPIWADNNMPNNFVIFKVKDPSLLDSTHTNSSNAERISSMLKNAEIIKSFDLSKESDLGKYIRTHVQQETFPKAPLTVSFNKNENTNYNGIDLKSGELTSKGEYIYKDFVETDKPLIEANDFITDGFKRNDMLCANLLNLEFLFDDDSGADYSVSRYFGLYVDTIDSGVGEISSINNNNVITFGKIDSLVDSTNPVTAIPSYKQMSTSPTLGYVKINDIFYKISNTGLYDPFKLEVKVDGDNEIISNTIGISHVGRSVNLTRNEDQGFDFVKMTIIGTPDGADKIAVLESREESYKFTFVKHTPGELINIEIEDNGVISNLFNNDVQLGVDFETTAANIITTPKDANLNITFDYNTKSVIITEIKTNLGDLNMRITGAISSIVRVDQLQSNVNLQDRTYVSNYTLPKGTYKGQQFSNQGTTGDIASALASAIHDDDSELDSYNVGSDIFVKTKIPGYRLNQHVILVNKENVTDFIKVENEDLNNILNLKESSNSIKENWRSHYLSGGNTRNRSVFVDNTTLSEISTGDYLETNYEGIYNKVLDIVEDIDSIDSTKSKIILSLDSDINDGETRVFNNNIVHVGLFSAYNLYDMDFDFYDTSNSDLKELSLETRENINYEPYENAILNIDPITSEFNSVLAASDIFDDNYALEPIDYFSNLSGILSEETIDEELSENITSEFDRLKENELKEFATKSRVVPNINKWVLKDSLNIKEQPYYLNINEAFGRTNFSPDLSAVGRSKNDMTHEWFYMDKNPKYLRYDELNQGFSYVNFIEDFELTSDLFKSTKNNYFDKFMISEGFEKNLNKEDLDSIFQKFGEYTEGYLNPDDINNTFFKTELKKKYTLIDGGDTNAFANTIFKGLKVVLKNRKEFANKTALDFVKSSEFNGYKFSVLLKTNTDTETNDIEFEVIQNKKFKFVIFFITMNLSDYWVKGNMNRKLLYELNHKIVYDHTNEDYIYANTSFDGALNWNQADFSGDLPYTIDGITHIDGSIPKFDDQILLGENGLYGEVLMDLYPETPGNTIYKFSIYTVEDDNSIKVQGKPVNVNDPYDVLDVEFLPNYLQSKIKYYYKDGGTNIHKALLEKLSINSVAEMINLNDDSVKYTTVEENGEINANRFTINFEDGNEIVKYATLSVEEDNDKPKSFKLFKGIIGYNLIKSSEAEYYPFLIRHSGSYTVGFKPVVTFTDMYAHFKSNRVQATVDNRESVFESFLYKHAMNNSYELKTAKSYYNRYNRCGTTFNVGLIIDNDIHDSNWGIIKNHFYHKVNEINPNGITKLSESSDKLPLYPRINEIAISKKDVNVFRSSWDANYYTRALSGGKSEDIPGTLDNTEEKSYLGSTTMKIKNEYDVTSFTYENVDSQEDLDFILKNGINKAEVTVFEDEKQIVADFYITDAATRLLRNDGVFDVINKYVNAEDSAGDKTTLIDDANFYINNNIIEKFVVDSISLYTRDFKGRPSSIINIGEDIRAGGFTPDNNFRFKSHKQKPMNFRLIYNKRLGYSYDIKPMIKIKS